mgnify:CR=1 FL=1
MQHETLALIKYRLEKAKEDFESAKLLHENKHYAQALNRSYYSIFHATRALLAIDNLDSKRHSGVIGYFNQNYIATGKIEKEYYKILVGSQRVRERSDYDDFYVVVVEDVAMQIKNAELFINKIENLISDIIKEK